MHSITSIFMHIYIYVACSMFMCITVNLGLVPTSPVSLLTVENSLNSPQFFKKKKKKKV